MHRVLIMKLAAIALVLASGCRLAFDPMDADAPGSPGDPIAAPEGASCDGDMLVAPTSATLCSWGCIDDGVPHCGELAPIGGALASEDLVNIANLADVMFGSADGVIVNGDDGSITSARPAAVGVMNGISFELKNGVAIFRAASFRLRALRLVGDLPIAFISEGPIVVESAVSARGCVSSRTEPGPGGLAGNTPAVSITDPRQGNNGTGLGAGASGGGNGGVGGASGSTAGGKRMGDQLVLVGGGGGGIPSTGSESAGGGGGGAVQLVSATSIQIDSSGSIDAGGCGGASTVYFPYTGSGGGAGGTIILEAPTVTVAGTLAVNGGGGGGNNAAGQAAQIARTSALGGTSGGGNGGFALASDGANAGFSQSGGGGAIGRIVFDARSLDVSAAILSPALYDGTTALQHTPDVY
jgi:hypothetical protein